MKIIELPDGHKNFTYSLGIPTPPCLGIIPKKQFFYCFPEAQGESYVVMKRAMIRVRDATRLHPL